MKELIPEAQSFLASLINGREPDAIPANELKVIEDLYNKFMKSEALTTDLPTPQS